MARIDGESVTMTEREARILAALIRCPGHPVPRETLMRVAGITTAKPTIVESYIKQLRKRHAFLRRALRTRYGRGYAFYP
ncbi:helix-turn-helix domain-containing protein [Rhodospirillum sp. A1_3_36]|uniref:helix-turn-helix domain-containing protein n=1 Tax=Rhodospirillum sp. A1_3_36 TaxID=3391666 RepID=UPI0039A63A63